MRSYRPLNCDGLETRTLQTQLGGMGRPTLAGHEVHAMVEPIGLVRLDGKLAVNQSGARTTSDGTGLKSLVVPIRGKLADVGAVRGTWTRFQNSDGSTIPSERLDLRNAQGSFVVTFQDPLPSVRAEAAAQGSPSTHPGPRAATIATTPHRVSTATGDLSSVQGEVGTITLRTDLAGQRVNQITLKTTDRLLLH